MDPKADMEPEEDFRYKNPDVYNFYKSPDGEDCLEKTYYYTKYSGIAGAVISVYEMAIVSKPSTIPAMITRFGRLTLPFAGMGLVFGSSVCILGQLRKKSDVTNHFLAGMIAGTVWGVKFNSIRTGHTAAVFLGCIAAYVKYFDYHQIPMFSRRSKYMRESAPSWDFTIKLYDDPGRPNEA